MSDDEVMARLSEDIADHVTDLLLSFEDFALIGTVLSLVMAKAFRDVDDQTFDTAVATLGLQCRRLRAHLQSHPDVSRQ